VDALETPVKGNSVASNTTRRVIALSAFAAAVAAPVIAATTISAAEPQTYGAYPGECLAWFGNQEDGKCLSYSNGSTSGGTPWGIYGPNNYQNRGLLPGQTYTGPIR
jgi:hypothetical protein